VVFPSAGSRLRWAAYHLLPDRLLGFLAARNERGRS
jgi:hypothetical protein